MWCNLMQHLIALNIMWGTLDQITRHARQLSGPVVVHPSWLLDSWLCFHVMYTGLVGVCAQVCVCVLVRSLALHSCNPLPIQKPVTHSSSSSPQSSDSWTWSGAPNLPREINSDFNCVDVSNSLRPTRPNFHPRRCQMALNTSANHHRNRGELKEKGRVSYLWFRNGTKTILRLLLVSTGWPKQSKRPVTNEKQTQKSRHRPELESGSCWHLGLLNKIKF